MDKIVRLGCLGRRDHLLQRRIRLAIGDILAHGAAEQGRRLRHHPDLRAQRFRVPVAHIHAIDQNAPAGHIIETREQADQRAFAGSGRAQQRHPLARLHLKADARRAHCRYERRLRAVPVDVV